MNTQGNDPPERTGEKVRIAFEDLYRSPKDLLRAARDLAGFLAQAVNEGPYGKKEFTPPNIAHGAYLAFALLDAMLETLEEILEQES